MINSSISANAMTINGVYHSCSRDQVSIYRLDTEAKGSMEFRKSEHVYKILRALARGFYDVRRILKP